MGARHVFRPYGGAIGVLKLAEEFKRLCEFFGRCSHVVQSFGLLRRTIIRCFVPHHY